LRQRRARITRPAEDDSLANLAGMQRGELSADHIVGFTILLPLAVEAENDVELGRRHAEVGILALWSYPPIRERSENTRISAGLRVILVDGNWQIPSIFNGRKSRLC
jgi:hypothetical protein